MSLNKHSDMYKAIKFLICLIATNIIEYYPCDRIYFISLTENQYYSRLPLWSMSVWMRSVESLVSCSIKVVLIVEIHDLEKELLKGVSTANANALIIIFLIGSPKTRKRNIKLYSQGVTGLR